MVKSITISIALILLLSACSGVGPEETTPTEVEVSNLQSIRLLEATPATYILELDELHSGCGQNEPGQARPNSSVIEARSDGSDYLAAAKRIDGWQIQFDCEENPRLIVNVVVTYETLEGAAITLSRRWHGEVWERIDRGELELLANIEALGDLQLVFQDANGTIGVEFVYRNVYFFLTGTADEGVDNYEYFADLAEKYRQRIVGSIP